MAKIVQKQAFTVRFDSLPALTQSEVYFDVNAVALPYSEDFPLLHYHDRYEVGVCYEGEGMFISGGMHSYFTAGDVFFIPPGVHHYSRAFTKKTQCSCRFAYFDAERVMKMLSFMLENADELLTRISTLIPHVISVGEHPKIAADISSLIENCRPGTPNLDARCELRLIQFLLDADDIFSDMTGTVSTEYRTDEDIMTVSAYLSLHYDKSDSSAELAALCRLSESQFRRRFMKVYGITPIAYRNRLRCAVAKELLLRTSRRVYSISERVGFSDVSDLYKVFKSIYGMSPTAYRAKFKRL